MWNSLSLFKNKYVIIDTETGIIKFSTNSYILAKEAFESWRISKNHKLTKI